MTLEERINEDIKKSMLAQEKEKLNALRAIKSEILLLKTSEKCKDGIKAEDEMAILQKLCKQRKESAEIYKSQNREDSYQEEMGQFNIISSYLPQQMAKEEIEIKAKEIISALGANSVKDMGKVVKAFKDQYAGKADMGMVSGVIKGLLS